jgi:hypothetical protein
VVLVLVLAMFAAALTGFVLLAKHMRRRGLGGALMGPIDEVWHPGAHRFRLEVETHEERAVPLPSADGER